MAKQKDTIAIKADPDDPEDFDVLHSSLEAGLIVRNLRRLRHQLGLSQDAFAQQYQLSVAALRDWEQGRATPALTTQAYLRVILDDPEHVAQVIAA